MMKVYQMHLMFYLEKINNWDDTVKNQVAVKAEERDARDKEKSMTAPKAMKPISKIKSTLSMSEIKDQV